MNMLCFAKKSSCFVVCLIYARSSRTTAPPTFTFTVRCNALLLKTQCMIHRGETSIKATNSHICRTPIAIIRIFITKKTNWFMMINHPYTYLSFQLNITLVIYPCSKRATNSYEFDAMSRLNTTVWYRCYGVPSTHAMRYILGIGLKLLFETIW